MASVLNKLADADFEAICHMIRRDARTDLEIAKEAERRLGEPVSTSDKGRINVVSRFRKSKRYQDWLERYYRDQREMEAEIAENRQRFEMLKECVRGADGSGFEELSNTLLAELLTTATLMPTSEKIEALGRGGWLRGVIAAVQKQAQLNLSQAGERAAGIAGSDLPADERARRMREIFGKGDAA